MLQKSHFKEHVPLIFLDCSKQNQFLKQASVDVRLEFESAENFPAETAAYCLIIHDRIIQTKNFSKKKIRHRRWDSNPGLSIAGGGSFFQLSNYRLTKMII